MQATLEAQTAVVTGAGSGIGLAATELLAARGAAVVGVDWKEATGADVTAAGGLFVRADVSHPGGWEAVAAAVREGGRPLRFVFLNAGVHLSEPDPLAISEDAFDRIVGVNVKGVFHGIRTLAPLMTGGGDIVVNASVGGLMAYRADPLYAMSKHAVIGLVRSSDRALERHGVRLHTLCPGVVDTPLLPESTRVAVLAAGLKPLAPAEVAGAALELVEADRAGRIWVIQPGVALTEYRFAAIPGL